MRAAVGFGTVAGWEFFEEEAGALGDVHDCAVGVGLAGELEAGGVLDGETMGVEGVGADDFFVGHAEAVVAGSFFFESAVVEVGNGLAEADGIGGS